MSQITGSVWNANNWHWEEKNYTKWGKEELNKILESFKYTLNSNKLEYEFGINNIKIEGDASISVRKKQPILAYEFVISGTWYLNKLNNEEKIFEGQISIPEFSVDNYQEDFPVNLTLRNILNKEYDSNILFNEIKKQVIKELRLKIKVFHNLLLNNENNQKKLNDEKLKREEEQKTTEIARITKEEEKKEIYNEQIKKEANIQKQIESEKKLLGSSIQPNAQGSVWNKGSWHWEERPETNWVKETLSKKIENLSLNASEITKYCSNITFNNVKVTGEASSSVRKGKKICVLDCNVLGKFNVTIENFCENERFDLSGTFTLSEINMIDTNDYTKKITFDSTQVGILTTNIPEFVRVKELIQKHIIKGLDSTIQEFCLEFLNK